ncbi:MAG TPA: hypothetical protein VF859_01670 [Burkholderiales bacterium]
MKTAGVQDKTRLEKLNPVAALGAKRARDEAARLQTSVVAPEKDAAATPAS